MALRSPKYTSGVAVLKRYTGQKYKLTWHKQLRNKGLECDDDIRPVRGTVNDEKLEVSMIRARSRIFELAYCNDWEFFLTFTIDRGKYDRYDLQKFQNALAQWIRDYNKKYGTDVKYMTIPEHHKNGAWHEHGFIMGLPVEHLRPFTLEERLPYYIRNKLLKGDKVYDWTAYREKFGFVDLEPIKSKEASSKYVTKYVSKGLASSVNRINAHLYYCSKGLKRAVEIKRGTLRKSVPYSFENEFVKIAWFESERAALNSVR